MHIFTMNGSHKEMPILLRGLVSIAGRDAHFIGDLNKLKLVWYENIRFLDLSNFFEGKTLNQLASEWIRTP